MGTDLAGAGGPHPARIADKREMYRLLAAGRLGNTIPQYFDLASWERSADYRRYDLWGVRAVSGGGDTRMRLNHPREQVAGYVRSVGLEGNLNLSPMIDRWAVLRGEVFEIDYAAPVGLYLRYVPPGSPVDPRDPWRGGFRDFGRAAHGVAALAILRQYLWPADLEDLRLLLDTYPGHVVEFSACSKAVGVVPHRNTVVWEVRAY